MASGLINLQTDLKSLRYGNDKPYITKNIGQAPGSQIGLEVQSRIDDTSRIAQMLIDKPGLNYLLHEAELQQINIADKIKNRGNKSIAGVVLGQLGNTVVNTAKILGSTLAQVPVNGTGTHFLKGFRTDTYLQPTGGNNRSKFAQFFGAGGIEGAPLALQGKPIEGTIESNFGKVNPQNPNDFIITTESSLDYDEKLNTLIPNISGYVSAKEGTLIIQDNVGVEGWKPYTSTGVKERFVGRDTNAILSQSKFVDPALENKVRVKPSGSVVSAAITIPNPVTGDPLTIPGIQTTATPGIATKQNLISGSISNKDVKYNLADNGNDGKQLYTPSKTYTGKDAIYNIGAALSGSNAIPIGNPAKFYTPDFNYPAEDDTLGKKKIPVQRSLEETKNRINNEEEQRVSENAFSRKIEDFRQGSSIYYSFDYNNTDIKRETRVNLGDQGKKKNSEFYTSYSTIDPDAIDTLNALDISSTRIDGTQSARDLAKLYFEIITPDGSKFLHFRAFIDSIDDNYNADWQGTKYVGRAENFYTYGGFERDISISFKIAAATRSELKPLYKKMVYLASATAPTYGGEGFMRGSLAKITVGSYFSQIPGVITSVKYNLIDGMPWEIAMQNPEAGTDDDVQELPMGLQCNVSFKAIHNFAPQTGLYHYFTNPDPLNGSQPFF